MIGMSVAVDHGYVLFVIHVVKSVVYSIMTYHRIFNMNNMIYATSGAGTAYSSRPPIVHSSFQWDLCCSMFIFYTVFCGLYIYFLSLFILFLLSIEMSCPFNFYGPYPFGILKTFLSIDFTSDDPVISADKMEKSHIDKIVRLGKILYRQNSKIGLHKHRLIKRGN